MIHELAQKIAEYLRRELDLDTSRGAVMAYGLEAAIGIVVKIGTFLVVTVMLGIFPQATTVMLASAFFRLPSGGAHCTAYYRCLVTSLTAFCSLGLIAKGVAVYLPVNMIFSAALGFAAIATTFWVPADTPAKPVTRRSERKKARIWAWGVLACYAFLRDSYDLSGDLVLAASFGLLLQASTLSPAGYTLMDRVDRLLLTVSGPPAGERR